jgi:hypothetical protein
MATYLTLGPSRIHLQLLVPSKLVTQSAGNNTKSPYVLRATKHPQRHTQTTPRHTRRHTKPPCMVSSRHSRSVFGVRLSSGDLQQSFIFPPFHRYAACARTCAASLTALSIHPPASLRGAAASSTSSSQQASNVSVASLASRPSRPGKTLSSPPASGLDPPPVRKPRVKKCKNFYPAPPTRTTSAAKEIKSSNPQAKPATSVYAAP